MKLSARAQWHPTKLLLTLALWLTTLGNLPLWLAIWQLPESHGLQVLSTLAMMAPALLGLTVMALSLMVWPRWLKPAGFLLLLISGFSSYFMHTYGVVIDPSMMSNALHTDAREVRDLLSWSMVLMLGLGVVLPGAWWWWQPVRQVSAGKLIGQQLGCGMLGLLVAVLMLWVSFEDLASLMRNHKSLRYLINPFNTIYAVANISVGKAAQANEPLRPVGEDARFAGPTASPETSPLIVLVVGETARAANFSIGGYTRETTPRLKALQDQGDLVYFTDVTSCGTNTQTSVPCMFSHLGRAEFKSQGGRFENLLDVMSRAGLAVVWLDNQSGCKGVCDRVPHLEVSALQVPALCEEGECFDEIMLKKLPEQLAALDPQRTARATVVVMHQMGSHGPAYYKRSPAAHKHFQPECTSHALQQCETQDIVNAYNNSLRYTDHFLGETVAWLQSQSRPTALLYLSDHGESLGEKRLYLHGMPYSIAPTEQTHVPMALWLSKSMQQARGWSIECVRGQAHKAWSHDNLFHTMLHLSSVTTQVANPGLDILAQCFTPSGT